MDGCRWPLVALLTLLLGGCHGGVETEVLERELRRQEDYIYQLQDQIEQYRTALGDCRQDENGQQPTPARGGTRETSSGTQGPGVTPAELPSADELTPPAVDLGTPEGQSKPPAAEQGAPEGELKPPSIKLGTPSEPPPPKSNSPPATPRSSAPDASSDGPEMLPAADMSPIERLVVRPTATDRPGLTTIVQRRTATGQVIPVRGAVSLMVLAPAPAGRQRRLARWDFTAEQIDARRLRAATGRDLQLNLPWPADGPPAPGRYQLWGRVLAADGQKLLTSLPVDIDRRGRVRLASNPRPAARPAERRGRSGPEAADRALAGPAAGRPRPATPAAVAAKPTPAAASQPTPHSTTAGRPTWRPYR